MTTFLSVNATFAEADINRFYESLMVQFDLISTAVDGEKGASYTTYTYPHITIHQALKDVLNNQTLMATFPSDIQSILTPLHIDVLHSMIGMGMRILKPRTALKILSGLTIDEGTSAFVDTISEYAEIMHLNARIGGGKPDRACMYRYLEEIRNSKEPDDDNKVYLDYNRIYNMSLGYQIPMSAFEVERINSVFSKLSHKDIEHYLLPNFDRDILPSIIEDYKEQWKQEAYRPDSYGESLELADQKTKLLRHLSNRLSDHDLADKIFRNMTAQIEDFSVRSSSEMLESVESLIRNTDAGLYDNITEAPALNLPTEAYHPPHQYGEVTRHSNSSYIYLLLPVAIGAFLLACAAKSFYRQANRWSMFASCLMPDSSAPETSNLIESPVEVDEELTSRTQTPTPTHRLGHSSS